MNNVIVGVSASPISESWVGVSRLPSQATISHTSCQDTVQFSSVTSHSSARLRLALPTSTHNTGDVAAAPPTQSTPPTAASQPTAAQPATQASGSSPRQTNAVEQKSGPHVAGTPSTTPTTAGAASNAPALNSMSSPTLMAAGTLNSAPATAGVASDAPALNGTSSPTLMAASTPNSAPASAGIASDATAVNGTPSPALMATGTPSSATTSAGALSATPTTLAAPGLTTTAGDAPQELGFQIAGANLADLGATPNLRSTLSGASAVGQGTTQSAALPLTPNSPQLEGTQPGSNQPQQTLRAGDPPHQTTNARVWQFHPRRNSVEPDEVSCPAGTHRAKAARTKTPVGECENTAADMELRQQDQLHAEEVFARMQAERRLHIAKLQAIIANLQTEIQRIFEEVALRRQKVHDDLMEKWEKTMFA